MASAGRLYVRGGVIWLDFVSSQGQRHRETTRCRDELRAGLVLARRKMEVEGLVPLFPVQPSLTQPGPLDVLGLSVVQEISSPAVVPSFTIADLKELWLRVKASKRSIAADRSRWPVLVEYFKPGTPIASITAAQLDACKTHLQATQSDATVNRYMALLRAAFNLAEERNHQHQNPFRGYEQLPESSGRTRLCSSTEYNTLITTAQQPLRLAIRLAYHMGLRAEETTQVGSAHQLFLDDPTGPYLLLSGDATKNGATTPLPIHDPELLAELKSGIRVQLHPTTISHQFADLIKDLKWSGLRFHDLRRSYVTNLRRAGVDLITASKLSRHKSLSVVQKHYSIVAGDDLREAAGKLGRHLADLNRAAGATGVPAKSEGSKNNEGPAK